MEQDPNKDLNRYIFAMDDFGSVLSELGRTEEAEKTYRKGLLASNGTSNITTIDFGSMILDKLSDSDLFMVFFA